VAFDGRNQNGEPRKSREPVLRDVRKKDALRYMEYRPNVIRLNEIKISARFRGVGDFGVGFSP
jgi:hypothetical protein